METTIEARSKPTDEDETKWRGERRFRRLIVTDAVIEECQRLNKTIQDGTAISSWY